jgi:hypothetical protein
MWYIIAGCIAVGIIITVLLMKYDCVEINADDEDF